MFNPTDSLLRTRAPQAALGPAGRRRPDARPLPAGPSGPAKKAARTRPDHFLELACRAVGATEGGFGLLGPDGQLAEFVTCGLGEEATAALRRSAWPLEAVQLVLRQPLPTRTTLAGRQFLGVPITGPGRNRGALYLLRDPDAAAFGPEDEALLAPLAAWLEERDLLEEARLISQVRLLDQVAQAASGHLDLTRVFQVALRELDRYLPLHASAIWLVEEQEPAAEGQGSGVDTQYDGLSTQYSVQNLILAGASVAGDDLGLTVGRRLPVADTPFADVLDGGRALYAELGPTTATALDRELAGRGANACFAVPLRGGDRAVGVLQAVCTRPTGFTNEQIQLLYLTADLLGPAINNGQLFARLRRAYEDLRVAQGQLIQAEKMRALGELAGGMAHEFNNSLCGVLGFLELALWDRSVADGCRRYLESARTCALDAAQTVRRVQDFARQRQHQAPAQVLDVNDLARQAVELTRHKWEGLDYARGTPVEVRVVTEAAAPVSGQPTELREVLTNLIFNAVDAMPQGGTLTVRTWSDGDGVFVAVQDTGVGIRDADRRRLFEPFFTTKEERGNGLGLSVTFAIVRRHGGDIAVESEVGRGSTFTVRLPAAPEPTARVPAAPPAAPAADAASLRVLVVEDEDIIRSFLETCLTRLGHRARLTADVPSALEALGEERFDVVLTDLGLPGVSGEEVARQASRREPPVPVVLLTGWADQLQAERITVEGVTRVLSKPVTVETLRQVLADVTR